MVLDFSLWIRVLIHPGEVFEEVRGDASLTSAVVNVLVAGVICSVISLGYLVFLGDSFTGFVVRSFFGSFGVFAQVGVVFFMLLSGVLNPLINLFFYSLVLYCFVRLFFGGGGFTQQTYLMSLFMSPLLVLSSLASFLVDWFMPDGFFGVGFFLFSFGFFDLFFLLYGVYLLIFVLKVVHGFSLVKAFSVLFLLFLVLVLLVSGPFLWQMGVIPNQFFKSQEQIDRDLSIKAQATLNASMCEEVDEEKTRNSCIYNIAKRQGNYTLCNKITHDPLREGCIEDIFTNKRGRGEIIEIELCDELLSQHDFHNFDSYCYMDVAVRECNKSLCNKITDEFRQAKCLIDIATKEGNITTCDLIWNHTYRDNCYLRFVDVIRDESLCYRLIQESNKKLCFIKLGYDVNHPFEFGRENPYFCDIITWDDYDREECICGSKRDSRVRDACMGELINTTSTKVPEYMYIRKN